MRQLLVQAHRWLALTMGVFFVVLGLTGSALVFYPELDRLLNPALDLQPAGQAQNLDQVIQNAQVVFPGRFLHSVFLASERVGVHQVWFTPSEQDASLMWEVMVHPDTAEVIGQRQAVPAYVFTRENLVNTLYTLHLLMFVGPWSFVFLGVLGVFLVLTLTLGLWLWWPTPRRLRLSLTLKRGASAFRRVFDLHRVFGIYGFVVIWVIAFSGICLALPSEMADLLGAEQTSQTPSVTTSEADRPGPMNLMNQPGRGPKTLADAVRRGATLLGEEQARAMTLKSVWFPTQASNAWRVTYTDPRHIGASGADHVLMIDAPTGRLLQESAYASDGAAARFLRWQMPLHAGHAFGLWGRVAVCVAGFLPLVLMVTGVLIWRRKLAPKA